MYAHQVWWNKRHIYIWNQFHCWTVLESRAEGNNWKMYCMFYLHGFYVNHVLIRQYIFYVNHVLTITILSVVRIFVSNLSILTPKAKRSWRDDCDFQCLLGCGCTEIYNSNFTFNMVLFSPGRGSGYLSYTCAAQYGDLDNILP